MPNLNVKGETPKAAGGSTGSAGGGNSKVLLIVVVALVALGAVAFILNTMGVVKLWGKKKATPQVVALPPDNFSPVTTPEVAQPVEQKAVEVPVEENVTKVEAKALPSGVKKNNNIVSGTGMYTVQISSWPIVAKANAQALVFTDAGFDAFVEPFGSYFRVCVGRFETKADAKAQMEKMEPMLESKPVVSKVGK
jgi:cell division septation protein DedD